MIVNLHRLPVLDEWIYGVPRTGGGDIELFTMPPKGKVKLDVFGYFFFAGDKFKPMLDTKKKEIPGAFTTGNEKVNHFRFTWLVLVPYR